MDENVYSFSDKKIGKANNFKLGITAYIPWNFNFYLQYNLMYIIHNLD